MIVKRREFWYNIALSFYHAIKNVPMGGDTLKKTLRQMSAPGKLPYVLLLLLAGAAVYYRQYYLAAGAGGALVLLLIWNLIMHRRRDRVPMAESLKAVE